MNSLPRFLGYFTQNKTKRIYSFPNEFAGHKWQIIIMYEPRYGPYRKGDERELAKMGRRCGEDGWHLVLGVLTERITETRICVWWRLVGLVCWGTSHFPPPERLVRSAGQQGLYHWYFCFCSLLFLL